MEIILKAYMEPSMNDGFMAWIDSPKNFKMLVQGKTAEDTTRSLLKSVKVAVAYSLGMKNINNFTHKEIENGQFIVEWSRELQEHGERDFKFSFCEEMA